MRKAGWGSAWPFSNYVLPLAVMPVELTRLALTLALRPSATLTPPQPHGHMPRQQSMMRKCLHSNASCAHAPTVIHHGHMTLQQYTMGACYSRQATLSGLSQLVKKKIKALRAAKTLHRLRKRDRPSPRRHVIHLPACHLAFAGVVFQALFEAGHFCLQLNALLLRGTVPAFALPTFLARGVVPTAGAEQLLCLQERMRKRSTARKLKQVMVSLCRGGCASAAGLR